MGERQPDMQRHEAGLGTGAEQHQDQHQRRRMGRVLRGANGRKSVISAGPASRPKASSRASVPKLAITR